MGTTYACRHFCLSHFTLFYHSIRGKKCLSSRIFVILPHYTTFKCLCVFDICILERKIVVFGIFISFSVWKCSLKMIMCLNDMLKNLWWIIIISLKKINIIVNQIKNIQINFLANNICVYIIFRWLSTRFFYVSVKIVRWTMV